MKHGSLFSGIGGFDLAAEWMGWENKFHCEWNQFGQKILKYYWPQAKSYGDITKTDFRKWRGQIDVLTGGFPCQPFSQAGKRAGAEDDRYLWPEMLRAIDEIRPTWVVGENVAGITTMVQPYTETKVESQASIFEESAKIITEEAEFVIETICSDLEGIGYTVQPIIIPACAIGAPHRRDRVWFIAHSHSTGLQEKGTEQQTAGLIKHGKLYTSIADSNSRGLERAETLQRNGQYVKRQGFFGSTPNANSLRHRGRGNEPFPNKPKEWQVDSDTQGNGDGVRCTIERRGRITPDTNSKRQQTGGELQESSKKEQFTRFNSKGTITDSESTRKQGQCQCEQREIQSDRRGGLKIPPDWENFPTQPPVCGGDDELPHELDGITFPKWRNESIKAYGNAIVPQVAFEIFKGINEIQNN